MISDLFRVTWFLKFFRVFISICFTLFVIVESVSGMSNSQGACSFSRPRLLFEFHQGGSGGPIKHPYLTADSEGRLHLFWTLTDGDNTDIYYMTKRHNGAWSEPVSLFLTQEGSRVTASIDKEGVLHTVWTHNRELYYSWVFVDLATNVRSWSKPELIPIDGPNNSLPAAALANDDSLHLVYSLLGEGLYHMVLSADNRTWSQPILVHLPSASDQATNEPRLRVSSDGTLNLVWSERQLPDGYPPTGVFFSSSADGGLSWSPPVKISGLDDGETNLAIDGQERLHIVYRGDAHVGGIFTRWSEDGGQSWQPPLALLGRGSGGLAGTPSLDIDSGGGIHMVACGGGPQAYYSSWLRDRWTPLYDLTDTLPQPVRGFSEDPVLAVALGNEVHVVFYERATWLWYTSCILSVPGREPLDYPEYASTEVEEEQPNIIMRTSVPVTETAFVSVSNDHFRQRSNTPSTGWLMIMIIIPPLVLVTAVVVVRTIYQRRRPR